MSLVCYWVIDSEWIDLSAWTGRQENTLPKALRDPDTSITHVSSLMHRIGDAHCDPRSGGIAGYANIGSHYGVGKQQFRRSIAKTRTYLHRLHGIPVTNVASAQADGARYRDGVTAMRRLNLRQFAVDSTTPRP